MSKKFFLFLLFLTISIFSLVAQEEKSSSFITEEREDRTKFTKESYENNSTKVHSFYLPHQ